jgi:hypothetical protein
VFWQFPLQLFCQNTFYNSYNGLVMAGYQGWFAAEGDDSNRGWYHYDFKNGNATIDLWPDMTELLLRNVIFPKILYLCRPNSRFLD